MKRKHQLMTSLGRPEFAALENLRGEQPVIFDVGANVGEFSRLALAVYPDADVHAFEPNPGCRAWLQCIEGIHVNEVAVGSEDGEATLYWTEGLPTDLLASLTRRRLENIGGKYLEWPPHGSRAQRVPVLSLDTYWTDGIDLLKIDVEGHEEGVLEGAARLLREHKIGRILFEYAWEWQFEDGYHPSLQYIAKLLKPTHDIHMWAGWNTPDAHTVSMPDPAQLEAERVFGMFVAEPR